MLRVRTSLYAFCLERASEALRNAQMSDSHHEYEYWSCLEAKWNDLADVYFRDRCLDAAPSLTSLRNRRRLLPRRAISKRRNARDLSAAMIKDESDL